MNITRLGSEYGKHYVIPELLHKDSLVYSFGIGEDITFDLELIKKVNCQIYMFDPTPKSLKWIKTQTLPDSIKVMEYGVSDKNGYINFDAPPKEEWVSYKENVEGVHSFPVKNISTIKDELSHSNKQIDYIKMDIEGSEYSVINDILENNLNPVQMSIEFHGNNDFIYSWINNNKILKERYSGYMYPNNELFLLSK